MLRTAIPLALLALGLALAPSKGDAAEVEWMDDLDAAVALAEDDGRALLVVFR